MKRFALLTGRERLNLFHLTEVWKSLEDAHKISKLIKNLVEGWSSPVVDARLYPDALQSVRIDAFTLNYSFSVFKPKLIT